MGQIASVAAITGTGTVFAVNELGVSRQLKVGDVLQKGETIRTVGDVQVELLMDDGRLLAVAPDQVMRLDENVAESEQRPTAQDSAVTSPATATDTVVQALERGTDLSAELEATAAGLGGGAGADGGSSFVQLLRIVEGVEPLAYEYSYTAPDLPPDLQAEPEAITATTMVLSADPVVLEGSPGVTYTVTLGDPAVADMTVTLSNGAVVVIPAGSTTGSKLVPVQGDDVYKDGETLQATVDTVQGGGFTNITVNDTNVVTEVKDTIDTTPVAVAVSVVGGDVNNVVEGNELTFRFSVNAVPQTDLTLNVTIGGVEQTVTIAKGSLFTDVTVDTRADESYLQGAATVSGVVNSFSPTADGNFENLSLVGASATATVVDDGDVTKVSISGVPSVDEGSVASYILSLTAPGETDVVVNLAYSGTAVDGTDFSGVAAVTIPAGSSSANFDIATIADTTFEGAEVFNVKIVNATGGNFESVAVDAAASNVNTAIVDNDQPTVSVAVAPESVAEDGTPNLVYTFALSNPSAFATTVNYTLSGTAANGTDYTGSATTGTVTIPAGQLTATVTIDPTTDSTFENSETVIASITSASSNSVALSSTGDPAIGTIVDDDAMPAFSINDVTVDESAGTITFTVTKTGLTDQASAVHYDVAPNTAGTPGDYTAGSSALAGDLNFAAGVATQTITLNVTSDQVQELTENFNVNLSAAVQASIADAQGVGTITDNDAAPSFAINDVAVNEDAGTITFTVTKTGETTLASSVDFSVAPNTAVTPGDYSGTLSGTLNFAANVATQTITLNVTNDAVYELTENFNVNLANAVNATIVDPQGVGTITDNDVVPAFSINDVTVDESAGTITFTVTKTGLTDQASAVHYDVAPDTAGTPGDYTAGSSALAGDLNFAAGVATQTITLNVTSDQVQELTENFNVNLSAAVQASIADAQGVGTITDNDAAPSFAINDVTVNEDAGTITFTVTKTGETTLASSVDFSVAPNTAVTPGDYSGTLSGTLNFAANVATQTITLNVTNDTVYELTENFNVNLANAVNGTITDNLGVGTITDNDLPPISYENTAAAWLMNESPDQMSFAIKPKSGGITLNPEGQVHWDILVKGDLGDDTSLATTLSSQFPSGINFSYDVIYSPDNNTTLFRFFMTSDSALPVLINENDQFTINLNPGTGGVVIGSQIINSDEYVRPHANYNDDYSSPATLDTGAASAGSDIDWLSTFARDGSDVNGGEFSVTPNYTQFGVTGIDYGLGNDIAYGTVGNDTLNGGGDNDFIDGRAGDDTLAGGAGADVLMGGMGNDTLNGNAGNDTLIGGPGHDIMTGGLGVDVFRWSLGDQGVSGAPAIDHLTDFSRLEGDTLNLADLLQGESSGSLSQYLTFGTETFGDTTHAVLNVSTEAGGPVVQQVVFDNYADVAALQAAFADVAGTDLIAKMTNNGNLITD